MATIEMRLENAARRVREELVRPIRLGRGTYLVASSSQAGHGYLVHVDANGTLACTCPAAQWEFPCKHAEAVRQLERQGKDTAAVA
jgi:hypothetical protein